MTRFAAVAILIVASVYAATHAQGPQRAPIGIVDGVRGAWMRPQDGADRARLRAGDLMHEGQSVFTEHSTSNLISIVLFTTGEVWRKTCSREQPCEGSYRLPAAAARSSGFWAFLSQYWTTRRTFPPIFAVSRAAGDSGPRHALLANTNGRVDLSPVVEGLRAGAYKLSIVGAPASTAQDRPRQELSLRTEDPSTIKANVAPGLYAITVTDASGQAVGSSAAVLILDSDITAAQQTWTAAQKEVRSWKDVEPSTIDSLLVRTLYTLDAERNRR